MGKPKRFEIIQSESPEGGFGMAAVILLDTVTGVQYVHLTNGYGGGMTALLDSDGKPVIWDMSNPEDAPR